MVYRFRFDDMTKAGAATWSLAQKRDVTRAVTRAETTMQIEGLRCRRSRREVKTTQRKNQILIQTSNPPLSWFLPLPLPLLITLFPTLALTLVLSLSLSLDLLLWI